MEAKVETSSALTWSAPVVDRGRGDFSITHPECKSKRSL